MAEKPVDGISLKALIDKENNRIILAEADEDFVDVLLSFLTMPMGTITRLIRSSSSSKPATLGIGCMNNLYESLEKLDAKRLQTQACKTMLLYPRNAAVDECRRLKLKFDKEVEESDKYYICHQTDSSLCSHKRLSQFRSGFCVCGGYMSYKKYLEPRKNKHGESQVKGVFVKGPARLIISDELEIMPASIEASLSLFSKLGVMDVTATELCNLNIGVDEVLTLLKCSLISKTPLTETLLKHNPVPEFGRVDFDPGSYINSRTKEPGASNVHGKIRVKLIVSKSKNVVCFAEASQDFVDLLFSFLTVPLGCVVKEMYSGTSKGCITHLYNSVEKLDAKQYLKSSQHREMLLSPKLAPNCSYENHPLGIEENLHPPYYYFTYKANSLSSTFLSSDETFMSSPGWKFSTLTIMDPKCRIKEATGGGFVIGPANFTVTDNLIITPLSPVSCLSLLNKLKVPFSDIEEHFVYVGTEEALRLLVASFVSESALTNAFLREPNPEY